MKQWHLVALAGLCGALLGAMAGLLARDDVRGLLVWLAAVSLYALVLLLATRILIWLHKRGPAWME